MKKFLKYTAYTLLLFAFLAGGTSLTIPFRNKELRFKNVDGIEKKQTALILGAMVFANGNLSDITKDRALTAIELYEKQKTEYILISGDHGRENYDEVNTIKDFLIENNVPKNIIFLDHAGFDTYDSMYRAKKIFEVENMIIITQQFHIPRALYIGKNLDMDIVAVVSDKQQYRGMKRVWLRERLATIKAVLNVWFHTKPKFLGETIPITGDNKASWD
ncbi:MAG: ElyC/SanA/YdcF family protein [Candidatus Magasanikbacteria bacterium]